MPSSALDQGFRCGLANKVGFEVVNPNNNSSSSLLAMIAAAQLFNSLDSFQGERALCISAPKSCDKYIIGEYLKPPLSNWKIRCSEAQHISMAAIARYAARAMSLRRELYSAMPLIHLLTLSKTADASASRGNRRTTIRLNRYIARHLRNTNVQFSTVGSMS